MREPVDEARMRAFMRAIAAEAREAGRIYQPSLRTLHTAVLWMNALPPARAYPLARRSLRISATN